MIVNTNIKLQDILKKYNSYINPYFDTFKYDSGISEFTIYKKIK